LVDLERRNGLAHSYVDTLPAKINFMLSKAGFVATGIKMLATHLLSPLRPTPSIDSTNIAWSQKNTAIAAQTFILACTSFGLVAAPMEGFDERRLCFALGVPMKDFSVPLVVSVGYPDESAADGSDIESKLKRRFDLKSVCFENKFGNPISFEG